jgi:hypothetical protein
MKKKDTIFVGGGFLNQQYPYLLPILFKYCEVNKIKNIIFETLPSEIFFKQKYFKSNLDKYKIVNLINIIPYLFKNKYFRFFLFLPLALFFALTINRNKILKYKNSFFKLNLYHAIWDTTLNISNSYLYPSFLNKLFSAVKCIDSIYLSKVIKKKNINSIFLNHSVYFYRAMLAEFREDKNIKLFGQADFNIHRHEHTIDRNHAMLDKKYVNFFRKIIRSREIDFYWRNRALGKSAYELANHALIKIKKKHKLELPKNILMLHIFKDSSYAYLDKKRIFVDYADWLSFTLKEIAKTDETWGIKFHPIANRWGEDSVAIFNSFIKKYFKGKVPQNFILISNEFSNYELFSNCKKLVTFWGTSHIEAACFGLKPIIIRETQLSYYDKNLVNKPKDLEEYKNFLTTETKSNILTKKQLKTAKFLIYLREKILNFAHDTGQHTIMRGDSSRYKNKNLIKTTINVDKYKNFLENNGKILSTKFTHTVSKKYTKKILVKFNDKN